MPGSFYTGLKLKINSGNKKIRKGYCGSKLIYSCGNIVTYVVNGTNKEDYVEEGATILSPTSFTPVKPGWTFRGWSKQAGSTHIQTNLIMEDEPITLYAVWNKDDYVPDQPMSFTYDGPADGLNYNPGGRWTASASVDEVTDIGNNTQGFIYVTVSINDTVGRRWTKNPAPDSGTSVSPADGNTIEDTSTVGYGGRSFSISGSGSITASISDNGAWKRSGGDVHLSNVVKKGYSTVDWSVG